MTPPASQTRARRAFAALLVVIGIPLAGCGTSTTQNVQPAAGAWATRENVGEAIALLNRGQPDRARRILAKVIERQPGDPVAASLLRQLDTPPDQLLGTRSFPYVTRTGDSMSELAQRFLRDPLMFYALARYNGIAAPGELQPGVTLRIPGVAAAPPARPKAGPATAPPPKVTKPLPAPAAPTANPAQARQLRMAGLEQLNRGAVDKAVALLRRAAQLDPENSLIRDDLERAQRIRRTVREN